MKWLSSFLVLFVLGCHQQQGQLSDHENAQIKSDIIKQSEKHAKDLINLDYKAVMMFYDSVDDFIIFGDGYYWGDYKTVDGIWKDFTGGVKKMLKWDFYNPKIHVFSKILLHVWLNFTTSGLKPTEIQQRDMDVSHLACRKSMEIGKQLQFTLHIITMI